MGIKGLMKIIREHAPAAIKENEMKNYFGRKVAIDASMSIYQFLIAVRQTDGSQLQNESGDVTSHLMGMFYRTIRMCEAGLKPLYVFDGKPPSMKSAELSKRKTTRTDNEKKVAEAIETGDTENIEKFSRRIVKCLPEHNEECKRLLKLMGIPYVDAPCEAESQCAAIAKAGKVYASGSEDMDTLCFGTPVLLRHLTFSEARKLPIVEVHLDVVLKEMNLTMDEFIDFSILLGCDYCDSIKGIGPVSALKLIREHSTIEKILTKINRAAHPVPDDWPYKEARELIKNPDVTDPATLDIKWEAPNEEGVVQFLVKEKQFNEERVRNTIQKLIKAKGKAAQGRVDSFFKVIPKDPSAAPKRKAPDTKTPAAKGKGKKPAGKPRR